MKKSRIFSWALVSIIIIYLVQIFYPQSVQAEDIHDGCTIGVAAGSATSDGRTLLWKTRDGNASKYNNEVIYHDSYKYKFITVITAGETTVAWMGVNEKGFAILDSDVYDLHYESEGFT